MSTGVVIRMKNLPVTAGTIDIRRFFGGLSIPDGGVHIIGGADGTAFILFATDEDARQAMLCDCQKIVGDKIKLMLSSHTEMRTMIEDNQRKYEELRGLRPPEPPITNLTSRSSATGSSVAKNQQSLDPDANDVYIELKGMPFNVAQEEIVEFFQNLPISAIRFMLDEKGRQSGQGFVRLRSHSSKLLALKKDRDFLGPRFVRVVTATEKQWLVAGSQMCDTVRPGGGEYANRKRGQSSTPSNDGTPKRSRALSPIRCDNCVELRGLPAMSTYKTVQELFFHLKFAENGLYLEMEGKQCRGRAFAEFTTIEDFKEALLKDGEILEGKQIRVINISRQAMVEQIRQHKKYVKIKREEEYKREQEELERKEHEKREAKMYEEQKRKDDEDQRKRREYQLKKQREMEVWLARQHEKEEAERKRQDLEKRLLEQRRIQAAEEERARREAEEKRQLEELRKKEEEEIRRGYERKRQLDLKKIELRIKQEEKLKIKQEILKQELENLNGNAKEVEMDLEDQNQTPPKDDYSEDYPPPPSDAILPVKPPLPRYSVATNDSDYSSFSQSSPSLRHSRPSEVPFMTPPPSRPPYSSMPYPPRRYSPPPPLPGNQRPTTAPLPPPARPPPHLPNTLPPPPLPPTIRFPEPPLHVMGDPSRPLRIPGPVEPVVGLVPAPNPPSGMAAMMAPPVTQASEYKPTSSTLYVRVANTPFTITEKEVREFFRGLEMFPNGIEFVMKNGKRSGHVFLKFGNEADAVEACRKDKTKLGDREVLVQASSPAQMTQLLKKYETRGFEELFPDNTSTSVAPSKFLQQDDLNLELNIMQDILTCVRLANVPPTAISEDILRAFTGISVMPNGVHILKNADGICNGSAFVELVTPEDCIRAANLHATAKVNGMLIRVMPVRQQDMEREIIDNSAKMFGHPPPASIPSAVLPPYPEAPIRLPPPPIPVPIPPMSRLPPPPFLGHEMDMRQLRQPPRPPLPPRGRSPSPPYMMNHRPPSPRFPPPGRSRSPPSMGRPPSPQMRPRSPHMMPPRDITREEMAHRAEMEELSRRIDHERAMMRDLSVPRGPYGDRPHFSVNGPRPQFDIRPQFDRSPFPGERPRFPHGMPRFPGDMPPPPHFMGDGPWRPRFPMDVPRFRMPHHNPVPLKMSNLSFHVTQEDILDFFIKFSPISESVRLMYNSTGKLTGDGMITLISREAAEAAMKELDQKPLLGRKVKLIFA